MKRRRTMTTLSLALGTLLALTPGALAGERVPDSKEISQMAKNATTAADHERVAQNYLRHANVLDEKADKLERELNNEKVGPKSPMEIKWPAMVVNARERKERLAMQTRRAAKEAHQLAEHHSKLSGRTLEQIASLD